MNIRIEKPCYDKMLCRAWLDERYYVDFNYTLYGSLRLNFSPAASMFTYNCSWCTGRNFFHTIILFSVIINIVKLDKVHSMPIVSNIKPYYNDPDFCEYISAFTDPFHLIQPSQFKDFDKTIQL